MSLYIARFVMLVLDHDSCPFFFALAMYTENKPGLERYGYTYDALPNAEEHAAITCIDGGET